MIETTIQYHSETDLLIVTVITCFIILLNFLNGCPTFWNFGTVYYQFLRYKDKNLKLEKANTTESDQTAQICRLARLYTWGKRLVTLSRSDN